MKTHSVRAVAVLVLGLYILVVGLVLLTAQSTIATDVIAGTEARLAAHRAPSWMTYPGRVELALNAAMFAPLTFLASLVAPRHPWGSWVAYSFMASGAVEVFQAFVLEPRSAQYADVVANTLGGLLGALLAIPVTSALRRAAS